MTACKMSMYKYTYKSAPKLATYETDISVGSSVGRSAPPDRATEIGAPNLRGRTCVGTGAAAPAASAPAFGKKAVRGHPCDLRSSMGIKGLNVWIHANFPNVMLPVQNGRGEAYDHVAFDLNGIVQSGSQRVEPGRRLSSLYLASSIRFCASSPRRRPC